MLLNLPPDDYQRETDILVARFNKLKRLIADESVTIELWVDVAEPQHLRDAITKNVPFAKEVDLKPYGGDYWILINGHIVEVIERKAGTDLAGSIRGGNPDAIRFGKERWSKQVDKLVRLPTRRITLLDEYKKMSNKALQHTRNLIPQLVGAITTAHCTYEFGHVATAHVEATIYYILKLVKKVADNYELYLSYARYHASFAVWRDIQSKALKETALEAKAKADASMDTVAVASASPRTERWTLTSNEMHELLAYKPRKPQQKTPKMVLLYTAQIVLSEPQAWSIMPYFESWSHFLDYFRYQDCQDVMDFVACLPLLKVPKSARAARAGNDEEEEQEDIEHEPAVLVVDDDDTDMDTSKESHEDDEDGEDSSKEDEEKSASASKDGKKKQPAPTRRIGPAVVKRIYQFLVTDVECTAKKARTDKQIAKLGKSRASFRPSPPGLLVPTKSAPVAASSSAAAAASESSAPASTVVKSKKFKLKQKTTTTTSVLTEDDKLLCEEPEVQAKEENEEAEEKADELSPIKKKKRTKKTLQTTSAGPRPAATASKRKLNTEKEKEVEEEEDAAISD